MNWIDDSLNKITMYRLVIYYLLVLVAVAIGLSIFNILPYHPASIALSALLFVTVCKLANDLFSKIYKAPINLDSTIITGLILSFLIAPVNSWKDVVFLIEVSLLAMASKYLLAIKKKHIFNPAAFAILIAPYFLGQGPAWWMGNMWMNIPVAIGGYLIVRKIKREKMLFSFLVSLFLVVAWSNLSKGAPLMPVYNWLIFHSSLWFFSLVMFTEPQTSPTTNRMQIIYGLIVGFLAVPGMSFGGFYFSSESALIVGNIFAYIVNSKEKLFLKLKEKINVGNDIYDFVYPLSKKLSFLPGQYMEWTLPHQQEDSRGARRYFTIASSPTENEIRLGLKFHTPSSSFKKEMLKADPKTIIVGSQLAGEFTLPRDKHKKLVFVAGGIGITPFRSMLKFMIDNQEKRDIVVFYSNKNEQEIVYKDILDQAEKFMNIKIIYSLTEMESINESWQGVRGRIDGKIIQEFIPDFKERLFYLSGPRSMVLGFEENLALLGVKRSQIKTDYFPGYA